VCITFENGDTYEGDYKNGKIQGVGTYTTNTWKLQAQFKDNRPTEGMFTRLKGERGDKIGRRFWYTYAPNCAPINKHPEPDNKEPWSDDYESSEEEDTTENTEKSPLDGRGSAVANVGSASDAKQTHS
jgi:hypothetical protein